MDRAGETELTRLALAGRDGDAVAVADFARATYRDVWRFCASLDSPASADDLTQEVYMRAIRALPGYRGDSSGWTWLFAIARRTVADAIRLQRRRRRLGDGGSLAPPSIVDGGLGLVELQVLLEQLDNHRRLAFVLTQVIGLSYAEAAEVSGCAVGTIRSRVARARSVLLGALDPAAAELA